MMIVACDCVVFGEHNFYDNSSHQFDADGLDNDTMYENGTAFDEITTERLVYKRSTSAIKLEIDTEFTYLNIGVLMASHLGEYWLTVCLSVECDKSGLQKSTENKWNQ